MPDMNLLAPDIRTPKPSWMIHANTRIRLWMLRILVPLSAYRKFIIQRHYSGDEIAEALGLASWKGTQGQESSPRDILSELREQHLQVELKRASARLPASLVGNIKHLSRLADLNEAECRILEFAICIHGDSLLNDACDMLGMLSTENAHRALSVILGLPKAAVRKALAPRGILAQSGLVSMAGASGSLPRKLDMLSSDFPDAMLTPQTDPLNLLRDTIRKAGKAQLKLDDYTHIQPSLEIALPYLRHALTNGQQGVNLLIHGRPGTGKSQLARTLAKALKHDLFEVSHESKKGEPINGEQRLRALLASHVFLSKRRALLVFDEAEDAFDGGDLRSTAQQHKAWINRMLEKNPVPTLWLSNNISGMDPAFIRRFDMVFELPVPPRQQRTKILRSYCKGLLDKQQIARIAELEHLAPAVVAKASHVVHAVRDDISAERTASAMRQLIDNTLQAQGFPSLSQGEADRPPDIYDPAFIHADADLASVAYGLGAARNGRLCLYGPPGTGKTAYGRWLARQLDMPLLVKRASDLISKYVGESEQNIAAAFQQAERDNALLLIDEVDSFLQDRRKAQRSWETSMVNEMLTRMESFPGVFIASTNLLDGLDQAALRRFDLKVKFDFLRPAQAWELLCRYCTHLKLQPPAIALQPAMQKLDRLTPGDFAAVARQHRFRPLATPAMLVAALQAECAVKERISRPIGFL
jgi:SpoVK/Ycf46/Vps4 family AAA+-type ATPase